MNLFLILMIIILIETSYSSTRLNNHVLINIFQQLRLETSRKSLFYIDCEPIQSNTFTNI